jgi:hypothetical protein
MDPDDEDDEDDEDNEKDEEEDKAPDVQTTEVCRRPRERVTQGLRERERECSKVNGSRANN